LKDIPSCLDFIDSWACSFWLVSWLVLLACHLDHIGQHQQPGLQVLILLGHLLELAELVWHYDISRNIFQSSSFR